MPVDPLETEETRAVRGLDTYRNYLQRFYQLSKSLHCDWSDFAEACKQATASSSRLATVDDGWLKRWLGIAWNTEFLVHRAAKDADMELRRIQNAWLPVQA